MTRKPGVCVGCLEEIGTHPVAGLGRLCDSCIEITDIVFEVELERVREARAQVRKFIAEIRGGVP